MDTLVLDAHFAGLPSVTFQLESLALCGEKKKEKERKKISLGGLKRDKEARGAATGAAAAEGRERFTAAQTSVGRAIFLGRSSATAAGAATTTGFMMGGRSPPLDEAA